MPFEQITRIVYGKSISQKQMAEIIYSNYGVTDRLLSWILLKSIQIHI